MVNFLENISLSQYTTFKIGGEARYFATVGNIEELKEAVCFAKEKKLPIFILGGGSNVLISDAGLNSVVIKPQFVNYSAQGENIVCGAGIILAKVVVESVNAGFQGLEWAVGIPGTIGGAVRGNSGAFGKETGNTVTSVDVFDIVKMDLIKCEKNDCEFEYRGSVFKKNPHLIIVSVNLRLEMSEKEYLQKLIKENLISRPREAKLGRSAGCFFKNIPWSRKDLDKDYILNNFPELKKFSEKPKISTGFLIDHLGLKGKKIGGASVPIEHANYIINEDNASSEDVLMLASFIKDRVYSNYGFCLEEEVELVGF